MVLSVRSISADEHRAFIAAQPWASFLQTPAWATVKSEWRGESLGWHDEERLVGVGLVLYRKLPKLPRYLAYLPEGPVLDWARPGVSEDLGDWLAPMTEHLRGQGAFGVRMGPPVVTRRWSAEQVKAGVADETVRSLGDIAPLARSAIGARVVQQLEALGWRRQVAEGGFAAGQPQYTFVIPLVSTSSTDGAGGSRRTEDDVLAGMNQLWRRNIRKAEKAGVVVSAGSTEDLKAFHDLYVHTAQRDHFTPRPLSYFETMYDALGAEDPDRITLWLAHHEGDLVAATIGIRVGRHAWYSYGASSTDKRDVRGSNAIQWAMIRAAIAEGAEVYDLRGITDTLDPDDPHVGLIQFKAGTGGEAVETVGEWDLPLNRTLYRGFQLYLRYRS